MNSQTCVPLCLQGAGKGLRRAVIDRLMVHPSGASGTTTYTLPTPSPRPPTARMRKRSQPCKGTARHRGCRIRVDASEQIHNAPPSMFHRSLVITVIVCASAYRSVLLPPLWRLVHAKGGSGLAWHQSDYLVRL